MSRNPCAAQAQGVLTARSRTQRRCIVCVRNSPSEPLLSTNRVSRERAIEATYVVKYFLLTCLVTHKLSFPTPDPSMSSGVAPWRKREGPEEDNFVDYRMDTGPIYQQPARAQPCL